MKFLTQDYYEILDVAPGADNEAVKRAYRLVRRSFRPDSMAIHSLYSAEETEAIGAKIDEAFHILSRPESAGRYAKYHRTGRPGMSIPRRPEDFFDQVHQLDAATPIEALARAVGADEVETDVPIAAVAQLRPKRTVEAPAEVEAERPLDPDSSAAGAVPEAHIDLFLDALEEVEDVPDAPLFLTASVMVDDEEAEERYEDLYDAPEPLESRYVTPVDAEEPPERPYVGTAPRGELDYSDVDALLASVSGGLDRAPTPPPMPAPAPPRAQAPAPAPPAVSTPRVAASAPRPMESAPRPMESAPRPIESAPRPMPAARPMQVADAPRAQASQPVSSTAPTVATSPVSGPEPISGSASTLASVAAVNRDLGPRPRRWSRETIRTRSVGQLEFTPLTAEDIDAFEMDCGGMGGPFFQQVRRSLNVSIEDIATRTKISSGMLRYIEAEELEFLPARVYLRGYLTQIGRLLKLPVPKVVDGYMRANGLGKK